MSEQQTGAKKKLSGTQVILIVGIVIILAAVIGVGAYVLNKLNQQPAPTAAVATPGTGNVVVDNNFDPDTMLRKAAENMFEVKMNTEWYFPDGSSPAQDAYVANSTANHAPFYFEVVREDTEDILYTSPLLSLGSAVENFTLDNPPPAGDYECICRYNVLAEDGTIAHVVSVKARVHVMS